MKISGKSGASGTAPVPTALQNQQLCRNAASHTCRTMLLSKIWVSPFELNFRLGNVQVLEDAI